VFRPELVDIFTTSARCPIKVSDSDQPLEIYRIERHQFKTSTFLFVSRVAFRAICSLNAVKVGTDAFDGDSGFDQPSSSRDSGNDGAPTGGSSDTGDSDVVLVADGDNVPSRLSLSRRQNQIMQNISQAGPADGSISDSGLAF